MDTTLEVGPLNIEGNSIWPCFSDGSLTRRGSFSHEPNLRSCFNGHASLVLPFLFTLFLPCCWMSGPRPRPAEGPDTPAAGDARGTRSWHAWSWSREAGAGPRMSTGLDLVAGRREEGRRPAAGRGRCCRGRPPAWGPPGGREANGEQPWRP